MFRFKTFDWSLLVIALVLTVISVATIYTITYATVGDKLAVSQAIYTVIGFGLFAFFSFLDYRNLKSWSMILIGIGLLVLIPLFPIWSHKLPLVICEFNSCRWIDLGFFRFQSSEFFKLVTIIGLAAIVSDRLDRLRWWHLFVFLAGLMVPVFLIVEQPDLGTAMVVLITAGCLLLLARFPVWLWVSLIGVGLALTPVAWQQLKPYQKQRVQVFLNPELDVAKTGYNVRQSEIAVGNGGLMGRGFGQGSQSQLNFLPVAHTDFIFAGYAEATGFVGSVFLVGLYVLLVWRALTIAEMAKDTFGRFVACGIAAMFTVQVFINIGMNIRLMPVTGVPLPLVSYGGTSLFICMIALGILESIMLRHKRISFT